MEACISIRMLTFEEIRAELRERRVNASIGTVWNFYDRRGISFKNNIHATEQVERPWPQLARYGKLVKGCLIRRVLYRKPALHCGGEPMWFQGGTITTRHFIGTCALNSTGTKSRISIAGTKYLAMSLPSLMNTRLMIPSKHL
jgi:hypothetical protein